MNRLNGIAGAMEVILRFELEWDADPEIGPCEKAVRNAQSEYVMWSGLRDAIRYQVNSEVSQ